MKLLLLFILMSSYFAKADSYFLKKCLEANSKVSNNVIENKQIAWLKHIFKTNDCKRLRIKISSLKSFTNIIPAESSLFDERVAFKPSELRPSNLFGNINQSLISAQRQNFEYLKLYKEFSNLTHYLYLGDEKNDLCNVIDKAPYLNSITLTKIDDERQAKCIKKRNIKIYMLGRYLPTSASYDLKNNFYGIEKYEGNIQDLYQYENLVYLGLDSYTGSGLRS